VRRVASLANPSSFDFDIGPAPLALSGNGRYLAFVSADSGLVENDFNGTADVFVYDLQTGQISRASEDSDGFDGGHYSDRPAISSDGRFVAFLTESTWNGDLFDANFRPDVFVKDMVTGTLTRIPVPGFDNVGSSTPAHPQLSFDGSLLVYQYASDGTVLAQLDNAGAHIMKGQTGDDIYLMLRQEVAEELPDEGFDIVVGMFGGSYLLPANVEAFAHALEGDLALTGNAIGNRFLGGSGNESWDGGAGIDILSFPGLYSEASVTRTGDEWTVSAPEGGTDHLLNMERIEFSDFTLALDTEGNARAAFALLYIALAETPDPALITPWLNDFDAGFTSAQVAQHMLDYFAPQFPGGIPNDLLISTLWNNLLGTPIPEEELLYYSGLLSDGQLTQAQALAIASEHSLNLEAVEPLIALGVVYQTEPFQWNSETWDEFLL